MTKKILRKQCKKIHKLKELECKKLVFKRDNYSCVMCNNYLKNNPRNMHCGHVLPETFVRHTVLEFDIDNRITLCFRCHKTSKLSCHQNPLYFTKFFKEKYFNIYNKLNNYL